MASSSPSALSLLAAIARFEWRYQTRSAGFVLTSLGFFLFAFAIIAVDEIQVSGGEAVNVNSPIAAAAALLFMQFLGMFVPLIFVATGVIRDQQLRTAEVFGTTIPGARTRMLGRYVGGLLVTLAVMATVPLGWLLGSAMPWLDETQLGPFEPGVVAYSYAVITVPGAIVLGTLFFAVANLTRSLVWAWVALVALFMGYTIGNLRLSELDMIATAALLDPYGLVSMFADTRYWTPAEQNTRAIPLDGYYGLNRLIWLGIAGLLLAVSVALPNGLRAPRLPRRKPAPEPARLHAIALPRVTPAPLGKAGFQQFLLRLRFETMQVLRSVSFWVLLALCTVLVVTNIGVTGLTYGTPMRPLTRIVAESAFGLFGILPIVIAAYYTAEIVWRDRAQRANEVIDATMTPSWAFLGAKLGAVVVLLTGVTLAAAGTGIAYQAMQGDVVIDYGHYAARGSLFATEFLLFAILAFLLQVLTNNKWVGLGALLIVSLLIEYLPRLALEHPLWQYGYGTDVWFSDMNGGGHTLGVAWLWQAYWALMATLFLTLTFVLWQRGTLEPIRTRLRTAPARFSRGALASVALSVAGTAALGGWIFYNTDVRNERSTKDERIARAVAYEERWRAYEFAPQPKITALGVDLDLYPGERRMTATGRYVIENKTDAPLPEMHLDYGRTTDILRQTVEGARIVEADEENNHFRLVFDTPMAPGERRSMEIAVASGVEGFTLGGNDGQVLFNGSAVADTGLPSIGWGQYSILRDPEERRKQGLPELDRMPKLEDERYWRTNALAPGADWIAYEARVTTDADQIAIAPGRLISDETDGDRRTFTYRQDAPIQSFAIYLSGDYAVASEVWDAPGGQDDVALEIFYHPDHPWNIERMMRAARASLDVFTTEFTPYQYDQLRIIEFPSQGTFAQSFANTIRYTESFGFTGDFRDPDDLDYATLVTAHEIAHQWFGHQVSAAPIQGGTMIIESLSEYAALLVMERLYGPEHMRRFLKYEVDAYLSGRRSEQRGERPLVRVENQGYIHYRKGGSVLYLLRDQVGEAVLNRAIRRFLEEYAYTADPYPRSVDLLAILREEIPPAHHGLLADLLERITLYDVETTDAVVTEREDGRYDVTLTVRAEKRYADEDGAETEAPLDLMVDVGVFAEHPDDVRSGEDHVIAFERRRLQTGTQAITLTVDAAPSFVGADPYNKLIDRAPDDNVTEAADAES